jgi:hypothetical protein
MQGDRQVAAMRRDAQEPAVNAATRPLGALAALAVLGLLASCNRGEPERVAPTCPPALVVSETSSVTKFRAGPGRDLTDIVAQAEMGGIVSNCAPDRSGVTITVQFRVAAAIGPANRERRVQLDYYFAVVDPDQQVPAREVRQLDLQFPGGQQRQELAEQVEVRIPAVRRGRERGYQVLVGFHLTPDELQYNRSRRRQ